MDSIMIKKGRPPKFTTQEERDAHNKEYRRQYYSKYLESDEKREHRNMLRRLKRQQRKDALVVPVI